MTDTFYQLYHPRMASSPRPLLHNCSTGTQQWEDAIYGDTSRTHHKMYPCRITPHCKCFNIVLKPYRLKTLLSSFCMPLNYTQDIVRQLPTRQFELGCIFSYSSYTIKRRWRGFPFIYPNHNYFLN